MKRFRSRMLIILMIVGLLLNSGFTTTPAYKIGTSMMISPGKTTFNETTSGYTAVQTQLFTITNLGRRTITCLCASLSNTQAFEITKGLSTNCLYPGKTATVSLRPKLGLGPSSYTGILKISNGFGESVNVMLNFKVTLSTQKQQSSVEETCTSGSVKDIVTSLNLSRVTLAAATYEGVNLQAKRDYLISGGRLVLKAAFVKTLKSGSHKINLSYTNGKSSTVTLTVSPPLSKPPGLESVEIVRKSEKKATINFVSTETKEYYYVLSDKNTPSVSAVISGGVKETMSKKEASLEIKDLTPGKHDVYIVTSDNSGGLSTAIKVDVPAYVETKPTSGSQSTVSKTPSVDKAQTISSTPAKQPETPSQSTVDQNSGQPPKNIVPNFAMTVTSSSGGSVAGMPSAFYQTGTEISISAIADSEHKFTGWEAVGISLTGEQNKNPITFKMPSSEITIKANFAKKDGSSSTDSGPSLQYPASETPIFNHYATSISHKDLDFIVTTDALVTGIRWEDMLLTEGSDYSYKSSVLTLKKDFLNILSTGVHEFFIETEGTSNEQSVKVLVINDAYETQIRVLKPFEIFKGEEALFCELEADVSKFVRLMYDNKEVNEADFSVASGANSTIITLKESYLNSFSNGTYSFGAEFTNGFAHLLIEIQSSDLFKTDLRNENDTVNRNNDESDDSESTKNKNTWLIIAGCVLAVAVLIMLFKQKPTEGPTNEEEIKIERN